MRWLCSLQAYRGKTSVRALKLNFLNPQFVLRAAHPCFLQGPTECRAKRALKLSSLLYR